MNLDDNTVKLISYISAAIAAIVGGSWFAIKKSRSRNNSAKQSTINQFGTGNKVTGGDDNSTSNFKSFGDQ
jgi:hypothetical protein